MARKIVSKLRHVDFYRKIPRWVLQSAKDADLPLAFRIIGLMDEYCALLSTLKINICILLGHRVCVVI